MSDAYDGRIRSTKGAIVRALIVGVAIVVAWNAPYEWYWRVAIFFAIMFLVGVVRQLFIRRALGI
jgi:hypothetical protein